MKRLALLALSLSCGGSTEKCAHGNCTLPGTTIVKWVFDSYPERGFMMDSCTDLGASKVEVDLTDAMGKVTTQTESCDFAQSSFIGLEDGDYTIAITPTDSGGTSIVNAPITGMVTAATAGMTQSVTIDVPYTAWTGTYTGTFLFRLSWGGMSCAQASPPVAMQILKLTMVGNGQTVTGLTDSGQRLDGTDPEPCRALTDQFPQSSLMLPFGPATLVVEGRDPGGQMKYQKSFDTFVGAGISNPTLTFDSPGPMPDAGVDAPPDAPIDAPPDAM